MWKNLKLRSVRNLDGIRFGSRYAKHISEPDYVVIATLLIFFYLPGMDIISCKIVV